MEVYQGPGPLKSCRFRISMLYVLWRTKCSLGVAEVVRISCCQWMYVFAGLVRIWWRFVHWFLFTGSPGSGDSSVVRAPDL